MRVVIAGRDQSTLVEHGVKDGRFWSNETFYLYTLAWDPPHEVFVNVDILPGGRIEVELLTPYGEPMPGYERHQCIAVTESGLRQQVRWKNGRHPWDFADAYRGGILIRFHLTNARLYAYTLTLPDPDGDLARDRDNTRWLETIKHRSDNWGRNSNEPATGLPQPPGT